MQLHRLVLCTGVVASVIALPTPSIAQEIAQWMGTEDSEVIESSSSPPQSGPGNGTLIAPSGNNDSTVRFIVSGSSERTAQVSEWLDNHKHRPTALRAFVQRMPKGADLHSHLSGAVYAESYLDWAADSGYCVDTDAIRLLPPEDCTGVSRYLPANELIQRPDIYNALINDWSTRNLDFAEQSGHDQFFQAFGGFDPVSDVLTLRDDMIAEVANRAAAQNISYLELMLTIQGSAVRRLGREIGLSHNGNQHNFATARQLLLDDERFQSLLAQGMEDVELMDTERERTLQCGTEDAQPGCDVTVNFIQQTTRFKTPPEVFAQFVYAFELAKADPQVVGINLVAPEDHPVALRDYSLQMQMLNFLHGQVDDINVSLHAGELVLGLVPPADLRFHIREAVEIAQAQRIGHGVGIFYEDEPWQLMQEMRDRNVLVEICLTSNDVILGVAGEDHPFPDYLEAGVPVALASDDEGVARIDLSHEFWRAAQDYDLSYLDLKKIARNSLEYSFLAGESLWQSPEYGAIASPCANDLAGSGELSEDCSTFLALNPRAFQQWQLEADFMEFESLAWFRP
ncbi:MAG: adenosine deaminase [Cyanobacteria bacterium P01_F01_bin.150]